MEARNLIFSVVMVFSTFVLTYRLLSWKQYDDPVIVFSAVIVVAMLALLFLSVDERLRKIERDIGDKERSLRVSLQSVEEEVQEKVGTATRRMDELREEIMKRGYR
jgi:Sec-independent protein translocase protein TatA